MDPQQRMLLETTWQAREDAGLDPNQLRGSRTGVYAGVSGSEYKDLIAASNRDQSYLGTAGSMAVGRIAFALGLEGPAMPIDMACASSLAAMHQAVVSLQKGEVDLALAGGVNVVLSPAVSRFMMELGLLSPTGHCTPFDASANGYVRAEGCGMVVLKRLSEAESDGDRIWAVIRGSAVNQNGASAGLTVPNGSAQQRVMEESLVQAGISPSLVDYLEAHATGSQLGDPIELNAAAAVYGKGRDGERPLLIGSVKSNIGHAESAAGAAAFIKTVLSMNKGVIPKHLHFQTPNQNVEWDQIPVRVTSDKTDWPAVTGRQPLAGVNAFGLSGANAHMRVEGYGPAAIDSTSSNGLHLPAGSPQPIPVSFPDPVNGFPLSLDGPPERSTRILPLSGKSAGALQDLAKSYLSWFFKEEGSASGETLSDMSWTAAVGRSHFPHRAGLVYSDAEQLKERLRALAKTAKALDPETPDAATKVAFVYSGEGSQWIGMGKALYRSEPVARAVLDRCDELIRLERGVSLLDVMFGHPGTGQDLNDSAWLHPALYALECAQTAQWASVGIRPGAVVGRGPGGLAAAQAAGVFTLEQGLQLASALSSLKHPLSEQDAQATLEGLQDITFSTPSVSLVGNATGRVVESGDVFDIADLLRQGREPVEFSGCATTLARIGVDVVVEIGPDSMLGQKIGEAWPKSTKGPVVLSTLGSPSVNGESSGSDGGFVSAVAGAYEAGLNVSFAGLFAGEARRRISVPVYPFQRRRHWV